MPRLHIPLAMALGPRMDVVSSGNYALEIGWSQDCFARRDSAMISPFSPELTAYIVMRLSMSSRASLLRLGLTLFFVNVACAFGLPRIPG